MSMTSAEILTNQNMEDPLIPESMSWSSESSIFDLYTCRLCSRAFPTTQALGGHQTAHRKEKIELLIRIQRQAEIDELKYAADNDLLLSPQNPSAGHLRLLMIKHLKCPTSCQWGMGLVQFQVLAWRVCKC